MKILIVEDEFVSRMTLQRVLESVGECTTVENGEDALKIAMSDNPPDLILLDILMPGIDGFEVCVRLKADAQTKDIPVIFLSANTEVGGKTRGIELGAVDYITKPFDRAEVKARVRTHLALKKMREDLQEKNAMLALQVMEIKEKTEQLRQKDLQLIQMDRIAGIGTLAAGIAHEVNNPLGFLKSSVSMLKKDCGKMVEAFSRRDANAPAEFTPEGLASYLAEIGLAGLMTGLESKFERIDRGIERIAKIVNSLRNISRIDREQEGALDINASIADAIEILSTSGKPVFFEGERRQIPAIACLANEINQCLLHVLRNAMDAVPPDGKVTIDTSYDPQNQRLLIRISDNGPGMSEDVRRQAFLPFFTTKPVGSGTGVGLTIAEHIVVKHGGNIELTSKEGEGTTVTIHLPVTR